jgi:FkbM family methyltransferase
LAFDIGANRGCVANRLAANFQRVVAFEPCRESFNLMDPAANVIGSVCAVSQSDGQVALDEAHISIRTGQLVTGSALDWGNVLRQRVVPSIKLDTAAEIYGIPDFIKIDTEGHEILVLKGGENALAHKPALVIEVHREKDGERIERLLGLKLRKIEHPGERGTAKDNHFWLTNVL